jgi:hypothetical protein
MKEMWMRSKLRCGADAMEGDSEQYIMMSFGGLQRASTAREHTRGRWLSACCCQVTFETGVKRLRHETEHETSP